MEALENEEKMLLKEKEDSEKNLQRNAEIIKSVTNPGPADIY